MKTIRIGSGAGYAGDRIEPAVELMEKGSLIILSSSVLQSVPLRLVKKTSSITRSWVIIKG